MDRAAAGPAGSDPLAELARLVGHEDPFRNVFKAPGERADRAPVPARIEPQIRAEPPLRSEPQMRVAAHDDQDYVQQAPASPQAAPGHQDADWHRAEPPHDAEGEPHRGDYTDYDARPGEYDAPSEPYETAPQHHYPVVVHGAPAHDEPAYQDEPETGYPPAAMTPDSWAEPGARPDLPAPPIADAAPHGARAPRRPLAVLAAVLVLTGGGLAATFLARTGTGAAVLGRQTPTILAATGPNKIKQVDAAGNSTPEDVDGALLNRNNPTSPGSTKVVNSQEQPMDLGQLPKAGGDVQDAPPAQPSSGSPFPEPRKVKTFLVRPDGTMISPSGGTVGSTGSVAAPVNPVLPSIASMPPLDSAPVAPAAPVVAPRPATPKTAARTPTTPRSAPATIADAAAGVDASEPAAPAKARQPGSAGVKPPRAKPIEVADASASITPAATGQGGAYGLQLAAAPSEQEARELFTRLQKKYSAELGPYHPTIRKADSGDKSVYRLRVGNLSQDQAKSICTQLQASGGSCFVVRN